MPEHSTNYLLSTYSMTHPHTRETNFIIQILLVSLNKTLCSIKLVHCLPTRACWLQGRTPIPRGSLCLLAVGKTKWEDLPKGQQKQITYAHAQHVWMESSPVRTSERQRSVSISLWGCLRGFVWVPASLWKMQSKPEKTSNSATLKRQYWSIKLECGNLQLSHHTH